jgi:hypothetical protein
MIYTTGETFRGEVETYDGDALANASAIAGTLVVGGVDTAVAVTVSNAGTGRYKVSCPLNDLVNGDICYVRIVATVNAVTQEKVIPDSGAFRIDTSIVSRMSAQDYEAPPLAGDIADAVDSALTLAHGVGSWQSAGVTLAAGQAEVIANATEQAIIDETDPERVLEAIVNKINAMTDLDALSVAAIAAGVLAAMQGAGTKLSDIHTRATEARLAKLDVPGTLANTGNAGLFMADVSGLLRFDQYSAPPSTAEIEAALSAAHGGGSWQTAVVPPYPIPPSTGDIDAALTASHGDGSWQAVAGGIGDAPTVEEIDAHLTAQHGEGSWQTGGGGGSEGFTGPIPVTLQFRTSAGAAVPGVPFTIVNVGTAAANAQGNFPFGGAAGVYTIRPVSTGGLLFAETAIEVTALGPNVFTITANAVVVNPSADPTLCNVYKWSRDARLQIKPNVLYTFELVDAGLQGFPVERGPFQVRADVTGLMQVLLPRLARYTVQVGTNPPVEFTVPDLASSELGRVI